MVALLPFILVVAVWTVIIKGFALWHAARSGQKGWFIALLIINTLGILEIVYLYANGKGRHLARENKVHHSQILRPA